MLITGEVLPPCIKFEPRERQWREALARSTNVGGPSEIGAITSRKGGKEAESTECLVHGRRKVRAQFSRASSPSG